MARKDQLKVLNLLKETAQAVEGQNGAQLSWRQQRHSMLPQRIENKAGSGYTSSLVSGEVIQITHIWDLQNKLLYLSFCLYLSETKLRVSEI